MSMPTCRHCNSHIVWHTRCLLSACSLFAFTMNHLAWHCVRFFSSIEHHVHHINNINWYLQCHPKAYKKKFFFCFDSLPFDANFQSMTCNQLYIEVCFFLSRHRNLHGDGNLLTPRQKNLFLIGAQMSRYNYMDSNEFVFIFNLLAHFAFIHIEGHVSVIIALIAYKIQQLYASTPSHTAFSMFYTNTD